MLDAIKSSYDRAIWEMRSVGFLRTADSHGVLDHKGRPLQVPLWECVEPSRDEWYEIRDLESPIVAVSLPGVSLKIRQQVAGLYLLSSVGDLAFDDPHVDWHPGDEDLGMTREQRLESGVYDTAPARVLVMDGGPEVPGYSLGQDALTFHRTDQFGDGNRLPDLDAYFALQLRGRMGRRPFDVRTSSWLDAYLPRSGRLATGKSKDPKHIGLYYRSPDESDPKIGARRVIRLREKT